MWYILSTATGTRLVTGFSSKEEALKYWLDKGLALDYVLILEEKYER
jgi:hypothetical protein